MTRRFELAPGVVVQPVGEQAIVLDSSSGDYFELNASGYRILKQLLAHGSSLEGLGALFADVDGDVAKLAADREQFIRALLEAGLLRQTPEPN